MNILLKITHSYAMTAEEAHILLVLYDLTANLVSEPKRSEISPFFPANILYGDSQSFGH